MDVAMTQRVLTNTLFVVTIWYLIGAIILIVKNDYLRDALKDIGKLTVSTLCCMSILLMIKLTLK